MIRCFCYLLHEHVDFIDGNEKFLQGVEDLQKISTIFQKILKFYILKTPIFQNLIHSTPP